MKPAADIPSLAPAQQTAPAAAGGLKWNQRLALAVSEHWLLILTTAAGTYIGLGLLAPLSMVLGWKTFAKAMYALYSPICHQYAHRSWFVFGEATSYASEQLLELSGIDTTTLIGRLTARDFSGTATLGWKTAYCQRDMAIYAGVLGASILYGFLRARGLRIRPPPWLLYAAIGLAPIGLDSLTQLLSQPPFSFPLVPWRESTPMLRTATGFLFGSMNVWLAYPHLEDWMAEIRLRHARA